MGKGGRPRKPRNGFEKAEIATFLEEGERIAGAYIVVRRGKPGLSEYYPSFDYYLFVNITGMRGYYAYLEGSRSGKARVFRSLDRILRMLRDLGYLGAFTVYDDDDPSKPAQARGATRRRPGDKAAVAAVQARPASR
nr:hypothetical protein [uncultured Acidocella sp.]